MPDVKDLAYQDYLSGFKYKDIAEKYKIPLSTVKSWAIRIWKKDATKKTQLESKNGASDKKTQPEEKQMLKAIKRNETLNEKQKLFCICYLKNFNATQAAINAGYSSATSYSIGYNLLNNVEVRAEIQRLKKLKQSALMADANDIIERYMRIAFSDMTDFAEWGREWQPVMGQFGPIMIKDVEGNSVPLMQEVNVVRFKESNAIDGALVSQIKQGKDGMSIKLQDQLKAMEWLSKYFLMNPLDKHKIEFDNRKLESEAKQMAETDLNIEIDFIGLPKDDAK